MIHIHDDGTADDDPHCPALTELIEKAHDSRYSDEWIGNVFRAIVGRKPEHPEPSDD